MCKVGALVIDKLSWPIRQKTGDKAGRGTKARSRHTLHGRRHEHPVYSVVFRCHIPEGSVA